MMKILQINVVYRRGSTGKIVACIKEGLLKYDFTPIVCYGRGDTIIEPDVYKVSTEFEAKLHAVLARMAGVDFAFSYFATIKLINIIKKAKPDVVHLHCINGHFVNAYTLLDYLKRTNIKTVLTLHAEIMQTAGCEHAMDCCKWKTECHDCSLIRGFFSKYFRDDAQHCFNLMKMAFYNYNNLCVVGVSEWLTSLAKESPIFKNANCTFKTIHNGIDTSVFHYSEHEKLYSKYKIPKSRKLILHVTPNFKSIIKGGDYVFKIANKLPDYMFVIVGYNDDIRKLPKNVIGISHTNDQKELACFYSMADCFICTSKSESLPTVCLEAAACGCPIVAFDVGGVKETIPIGRGYAVKFGDIDDFISKIVMVVSSNSFSNKIEVARDYKEMVLDYIDIYKN